MGIFINRTLNMKKIKAIGFDMDYTIVRYNTEAFEKFTHGEVLKKLVSETALARLKIVWTSNAILIFMPNFNAA